MQKYLPGPEDLEVGGGRKERASRSVALGLWCVQLGTTRQQRVNPKAAGLVPGFRLVPQQMLRVTLKAVQPVWEKLASLCPNCLPLLDKKQSIKI